MGKTSTTVQFEDHQIEWLTEKSLSRSLKIGKRISVSEINREVVQQAIDREKVEAKKNV